MKKVITVLVVLTLLFSLSLPVSAAGVSDWIELLETSTVNDSGSNLYILQGSSGYFNVKTPMYMRVTKVDVIVSHASGQSPKFLKVKYSGGYYTLTRTALDAYTTRFYGDNIPDAMYADLMFEIAQNGSGNAYYQILSCKVSSLNNSTYSASSRCEIGTLSYTVPFNIEQAGRSDGSNVYDHFQFNIVVTDWKKFDKVVISGSISTMALNGIRATIGGLGLPYTISYAVSNSGGGSGSEYTWNEIKYYSYDDSYKGSSETDSFYQADYLGKVLFTITIDLAGVDRTMPGDLYVYFTCLKSDYYGYGLQFLQTVGTISVADTTNANWWTWGKGIMYNLEQLPKKIAEEFSKLYTPDQGKIESVKDQSADLAEDRLGAVAQAGSVIDSVVGSFTPQTALDTLTVPVLTVPLGEVDWIIGGWEVQVVPDAFKPIVEILKTVIDIVATLAFVSSMRTRFEKLLAGGNA